MEVRGRFQELTARSNKLKMSVGNEPRRCKEKKVCKLQILGHPKGEGELDSANKHVRTRKKSRSVSAHLFLTRICCLFLSF